MFTQSHPTEIAVAVARSSTRGELDLAITMIQDMSVRSPPYSGFGSKINPVLTIVAGGPSSAKTTR